MANGRRSFCYPQQHTARYTIEIEVVRIDDTLASRLVGNIVAEFSDCRLAAFETTVVGMEWMTHLPAVGIAMEREDVRAERHQQKPTAHDFGADAACAVARMAAKCGASSMMVSRPIFWTMAKTSALLLARTAVRAGFMSQAAFAGIAGSVEVTVAEPGLVAVGAVTVAVDVEPPPFPVPVAPSACAKIVESLV